MQTENIPGSPGWSYSIDPPGVHRLVKDPDAGPDDPQSMWKPRLPWVPIIRDVYVLTDSDGSTLDVQVELAIDGQTEMCRLDDIRDGLVWTRFHSATGATSRHVKDVLSNICLWQVSQRERIPIVPSWRDGRLCLPPSRVMPEGYAAPSAVPEHDQQTAWRRIASYAEANPKLAFVIGAALGGVFVEPLSRGSFWVHMTGGSSQGKTTTLMAAAAVFGDPRLVITPWNGTPLGTTVALGQLGCLTAFKDELGSMSLSVQGLEDLIFKTTEGNRRSTSSRDGRARRSRPWRGVLVSTGNETITGRILNEGVAAARVVEIETPLLADAETAEDIERLAQLGAGWPLAQSITDEMDMPGLIESAEGALKVAQGGVERRLDRHLVTAVAGAILLDRMLGTDAYGYAALAAARDIRVRLHAELTERGISPMDRLEAAVLEELAADAGSFPTVDTYRHREIEYRVNGFDRRGDDVPHVVVLPNALRQLAGRHGIVDIMPAIRAGVRDGRIITQGTRHQRSIRLGPNHVTRGYHIVIHDLDEAGDHNGHSGNNAGQQGGEDGAGTGHTAATPLVTQDTLLTQREQSAAEPLPPSAPSWSHATVVAPCVDCGVPTPMRNESGRPQHAYRGCQTVGTDQTPPDNSQKRDYGAELHAFTEAVRRRRPDASDADLDLAYRVWEVATRGVRFIGSPAATGLSWFHRVTEMHGSIPELETPPKMPDLGHVVTLMDGVAQINAPLPGAPVDGAFIRGFDVNAQYLAAAGSVECGIGPIEDVDPKTWDTYRAGYVRFDGEPFPYVAADAYVPIPLARYLAGRYPNARPARVYAFRESRRALAAWAKKVREARVTLLRRTDYPGMYAMIALKQVYSAFLGGMLRSGRVNHSDAHRADWSDATMALSTANMHRAFDKSMPRPFAWRRDTAYWALNAADAIPQRLEVSDQPGKWKDAQRTCSFTEEIRHEILQGSAERINRAIIAVTKAAK